MKPFTLIIIKHLLKGYLPGQSAAMFGLWSTHQNHLTSKLNYLIKFCYLKSWVWMDFFFKVFMS